jgi:Deoxynucleotide monophosphate kinase
VSEIILALTGPKNSGKDLIGAYLVKQHKFERRAIADKIKDSFCRLTNISLLDIEEYKNNPDAMFYVTVDNEIITAVTIRHALQVYGHEAHKPVFGDNCWIDLALPVGGFYAGRAIVVTDLRYEVEADRVRLLKGFIIRVIRPAGLEQDPHSSEQEYERIHPDYTIINDGSIDDLYNSVETMLEELVE